jgi:hypothetical protein
MLNVKTIKRRLSLQDEGIYKEEGIVPAVFNLGIVWA